LQSNALSVSTTISGDGICRSDLNAVKSSGFFLNDVSDHSVTMFDRAFLAAELLCNLVKSGTERHFVVPAKSNTRWTVIEGNAQDAVVEMKVSPAARKKAPGLPTHWHVRAVCVKGPQGKPVYLLTSLFDRKRFKAA
jgi:hypothetical protein